MNMDENGNIDTESESSIYNLNNFSQQNFLCECGQEHPIFFPVNATKVYFDCSNCGKKNEVLIKTKTQPSYTEGVSAELQIFVLGRKAIRYAKFHLDGDFQSMYAAERWLSERGYKTGSTCAGLPTAAMKGDAFSEYELPQKWKNMTQGERNSVHAVMIGDNRNGPLEVYIFE